MTNDPSRCTSCGKPYEQADMDGGRCTGCGTMIAAEYPSTCILTGAEGENPDDCTTHAHEDTHQRQLEQNHERIMRTLPVRACSIMNTEHPEWGTWGVMEDCGSYYEIHGRSGSRILSKNEAVRFWAVVGS